MLHTVAASSAARLPHPAVPSPQELALLHRMGRQGDNPAAEQHSASLAMDRLRFESKPSSSGQPRSLAPRQHAVTTSRTVVPLNDPAHHRVQTTKAGHRFSELCPGKVLPLVLHPASDTSLLPFSPSQIVHDACCPPPPWLVLFSLPISHLCRHAAYLHAGSAVQQPAWRPEPSCCCCS